MDDLIVMKKKKEYKFIPDFNGIVNRLVTGKTVEWIDPIDKSLKRGTVAELEFVVLEGAEDECLHKPMNPYRLNVRGKDGHNYTLGVETVLFADKND